MKYLNDKINLNLLVDTTCEKTFKSEIKVFLQTSYLLFFTLEEHPIAKEKYLQYLEDDLQNILYKDVHPNCNLTFDDKIKILTKLYEQIFKKITKEDHFIVSIIIANIKIIVLCLETQYKRQKKGISSFRSFVEYMIENRIYDTSLINSLKLFDDDELETILDSRLNFIYDLSGVEQLKRYTISFEGISETPIEMFFLIACCLGENKKKIIDFFYLIAEKKLSLATPVLGNLRLKSSKNLASCFILQPDDSITSIYYTLFNSAKISKEGGGVGICFSRIRSSGMPIGRLNNSSTGVIPVMKVFNDITLAVNQNGKRNAAFTLALDIWHLDFLEFLHSQLETGNIRNKIYDVFPQIIVCDLFMKKVIQNEIWFFFDPYEIKSSYKNLLGGRCISELYGEEFENVYETIVKEKKVKLESMKAKTLMKKIIEVQLETGLPYIFFKDTVNKMNPNKHAGIIPCGNLCQESFTNTSYTKVDIDNKTGTLKVIEGESHVCTLSSLNLANIELDELQNCIELSVELLNKAVLLCEEPTYECMQHNLNYNTIGLGVLGLHDMLAKKSLFYGSDEGNLFIEKLFEDIAFFAYNKSADLAIQYGRSYKKFKGSDWEKGKILNINFKTADERWIKLRDKIQKTGIYNSQILAIAPNTSSSLLQCSSASVLPIYSMFTFDGNAKNISIVFPRFILKYQKYYQSTLYTKIDLKKVIKTISYIQKWVDQGISFEVIYDMNNNLNANTIYENICTIWRMNIKTIYYTRSIQVNISNEMKKNIKNEVECEGCSM